MAITLLSFPSLSPICPSPSSSRSRFPSRTQLHRHSFVLRSSLENSTVVTKEEEVKESTSSPSVVDTDFRGCKACGKEEIENGCNGEGRIQGGIATVPGFGWWPIKAYRPCPGFVASGGRYRRQGQTMDEVVSGSSRKATSK
ncbi:hypothetical protein LUZ62_030840 [Rhynchospora pubera]|uniref:Uncharacterized protein n=1 Tax=Rhynchospora pubera TaxID=906938 RepID=A0AAV8HNU6_9POAL|nr:hypothetical protein LUZ62_030840 [Rhynchospora pubera]